MRFLLVYFQKRIVRDTVVYVYSTAKRFTASVDLQGASNKFSVTYYDGSQPTSPSTTSNKSVTMWLNDVSDEEALLYREVYGAEAYLAVDENGDMKLISKLDFESVPGNTDSVVQPHHLQQTIQA